MITKLIEETNVEFPVEFLKKWLLDMNRDKLTAEQIDKDYEAYEKSLKWQLIENNIITTNNIVVAEAEVRQYIKDVYLGQYFPKPENDEQDKRLDSVVDTIMKNNKEVKRIYDEMYDKQLIELFKQNVSKTSKEIVFEDFVKLVGHNHHH